MDLSKLSDENLLILLRDTSRVVEEEAFRLFVQYSAEDTVLVKDINEKMRLIELAFTMAYTMKCNVQDVYKTVLPWEVYIFNHLVKKNIAYPPKKFSEDGDFEGGYVKEPKQGLHGWTLTFDFSSLYPSIIRQWNISPETFSKASYRVTVDDMLCGTSEDVVNALSTAKHTNCAIAANGTMYDKSRVGFLPELMKECMDNRKAARRMVLELEKEYERTGDKAVENKISSYNNEQMAAKILANSVFGACGNAGFHFFNREIAEAITWTGQFSDIHLANTLNIVLNKLLKTKKIDYVIYADTDSTFLNVQPIVDAFYPGKQREEVTSFLDKFGNTVCQDAVQSSVDGIFDMMNCNDNIMASKREVIASKVLFRGKKKYGMYVHDAEGVRYESPKIKVKGLEIVRSSTPKWCREKLRECLKMIFETDEQTFRLHFAKLKATFMTLPPSEIAFPRGCSDIDKWSEKGKPKKGTPIAVRAALVYNDTIKSLNNYQKLQNGDKTKFIYLTLPNPIKQNVIGWPSNFELPKEFKLGAFIDYTTQFQKAFENPLTALTDCAGWQLEERASLTNFFE